MMQVSFPGNPVSGVASWIHLEPLCWENFSFSFLAFFFFFFSLTALLATEKKHSVFMGNEAGFYRRPSPLYDALSRSESVPLDPGLQWRREMTWHMDSFRQTARRRRTVSASCCWVSVIRNDGRRSGNCPASDRSDAMWNVIVAQLIEFVNATLRPNQTEKCF